METLRANIGQPDTEETRMFKAKVDELVMTQFDRYLIQPILAAARVGGELLYAAGLKSEPDPKDRASLEDVFGATSLGVIGGTPGGTRAVSAVGQIKGLPKGAAEAVRKVMQAEMKSRGMAQFAGEADQVASELLRGVWWHGRDTYVKAKLVGGAPGTLSGDLTKFFHYEKELPRPDFRHARGKDLEFGEPTGISLSAQMQTSVEGFSGTQDAARVTPLFGGPPESQVVYAWTESGGKVAKKAYENTLVKLIAENPQVKNSLAKKLQVMGGAGIKIKYSGVKSAILDSMPQKKFNELIAKEYENLGFKGILYSPHRFGEYELKMFNPQDALMVDKRTWSSVDPTLSRMNYTTFGGNPRLNKWKDVTKPIPASIETGPAKNKVDLADWYSQIDLDKLVRRELGEIKPTPAPVSSVMVRRQDKSGETFFPVFKAQGKGATDTAAGIEASLTKHFEKEDLPSFSVATEVSKYGDKGFLDLGGMTQTPNSPWSDMVTRAYPKAKQSADQAAGLAELFAKESLGLISNEELLKGMGTFNSPTKSVDLTLGVAKGTEYLGGAVSDDLLATLPGQKKFDELRMGSNYEPLEELMSKELRREAPDLTAPLSTKSSFDALDEVSKAWEAGKISSQEANKISLKLIGGDSAEINTWLDTGTAESYLKAKAAVAKAKSTPITKALSDTEADKLFGITKPAKLSDSMIDKDYASVAQGQAAMAPTETFSWLNNKLGIDDLSDPTKLTPGQYHFEDAGVLFDTGKVSAAQFSKLRLQAKRMMDIEKMVLEQEGNGAFFLEVTKKEFENGGFTVDTYTDILTSWLDQ